MGCTSSLIMHPDHAEDVTYSMSWRRVTSKATRNAATGHLGDEHHTDPTGNVAAEIALGSTVSIRSRPTFVHNLSSF